MNPSYSRQKNKKTHFCTFVQINQSCFPAVLRNQAADPSADAMMKRCIAMLAAVACSAELTSAFLAPAPLALRSNVAAMPLRRAAGVTSLRAKTVPSL